MRFEPAAMPEPDDVRKALREIPRERWATVLGMVFVQQMPQAALEQIVREGRRTFVQRGLKTDIVGLKGEDYSDIYHYIVLAVSEAKQREVLINVAREAEARGIILPS